MSDKPTQFELPETAKKVRLDRQLSDLLEVSRAEVQRLIADARITCNGKALERRSNLSPGSRISVDWPEEIPADVLQPQDIPLEILYEDDDVRVINKPAGLVVHPGDGTPVGTLANALVFLEPALAALDSGDGRPGIVHRLDRDTSGVIVTARTAKAAEGLKKAFANRLTNKIYLAITRSWPRAKSPLTKSIGRHPTRRHKMTTVAEGGKTAVTHYEMIAAHEQTALLALRIETGRTHQIRVHLSNAGAPILGDEVYARGNIAHAAPRQMLHAWQLSFPHPTTGEIIVVEAPIPDDIRKVAEAANIPVPDAVPDMKGPDQPEDSESEEFHDDL